MIKDILIDPAPVAAVNIPQMGKHRWNVRHLPTSHADGTRRLSVLGPKMLKRGSSYSSSKKRAPRSMTVQGSYKAKRFDKMLIVGSSFTKSISHRRDRATSLRKSIRAFLGRTTRLDYTPFEEKLRSIARLGNGWDTYSAGPISAESCDGAGRILNALKARGLPVFLLTATSDESILLKHQAGTAMVTWEIDSDGELGTMVEREEQPPKFQSVNAAGIVEFIENLR